MSEGEALPFRREIKSFVKREGRMTDAQARAFETLWARYGLDLPTDVLVAFGRRAPLVLEIGFGNGDHLFARAQAEPEKNFLGAEVHRPGAGRLMNRAAEANLANLRVVCHDAVELLRDHLPPACLSEAVIQFPDPWHKTRHHKRRLVQPAFASLLATRMVSGGVLQLATDWADYATQMLDVLNAAPEFANTAPDRGYAEKPATRLKTKFEARGERLGHAVFDLVYRKL